MSTRNTSEILKWLDDRAIGGHPDQVNPDERFRRAADIIRLQEMRAHKSADSIARLEGENALMRLIADAADNFVRNGVPEECAELWRALKAALASLTSGEAKT